jgi:hypothetical protein
MNAKPNINQKMNPFLPPDSAANWSQLQHIKTLMGLSRRRCSKDDVLTLIDTRQIKWAWDIARKDARRPEVRIWRESLIAYLAGENGGAAALTGDLSLPQVIEAVLPRPASLGLRAATMRGKELQRRFLCSGAHLGGLIADGELCQVGPGRRGATCVILYQSAVEFLKRRSMSI